VLLSVLAPRAIVERLRGQGSPDVMILSPTPAVGIPVYLDADSPAGPGALQSEGDQADKGSCNVGSDSVSVAAQNMEELAG